LPVPGSESLAPEAQGHVAAKLIDERGIEPTMRTPSGPHR
jgi:hypothetical protein